MGRFEEELRKQGVTRGFAISLGLVLLACVAFLWWMSASAALELDRNAVPRSLWPRSVSPAGVNARVAVPYDPGRDPTSRSFDGVANLTAGGSTVRLKYQWVTPPVMTLVRPDHAEQDGGRDAGGAGQGGTGRLALDTSGKAEPYNPHGYEPHCQSPKTRDDSDLCAQRLAAREAASANVISRSALAMGWLNLVVTSFVGVLTVVGLIVAAQATRLAATGLDDAARVARGQIVPVMRASGAKGARQVQGRFENVGESPAEVVGFEWQGAPDLAAAELLLPMMRIVSTSTYVMAREKGFSATLASEPAFAVIVDYDDIIGGRWRRWAVFERNAEGGYMRRKHGEQRRS